jgi:tyrosyl-DNA phosphodiesterase 2
MSGAMLVSPTERLLEPFSFDPAAGVWVPDRACGPAPGDAGARRFTLVTWNVWFGRFRFAERLRALLDVVRAQDPDVICLQEIVRASLATILEEPWIRAGYRISDVRGDTFDDYGVVILTRLPVRALSIEALPSRMDRCMVTAEVEVAGRPLAVGSVHLESIEHNRDARRKQLAIASARLKARGVDAVLAGDFNFCSSWAEENDRIDPAFVDLWPALRRDPGYSEDTSINTMRFAAKGKVEQVRFDRVLLHSVGGAFRARSIELLGTAPIAPGMPDVFPSDHFGLVAGFEV